ncbi:golgin candidate 5 [Tanacetum coccineum]|uniref:Golgin candidate 5 n=1 Tax=Tanacetum coccineum TaxID=301880 RepID=A0ABQ4ZUP5_9ASTR
MLPASGAWPADLMAFMGQKGVDVTVDSTEKLESSSPQASSLSKEKEGAEADKSADPVDEHSQSVTEEHIETVKPEEHEEHHAETNTEILEEVNNATEKPQETNVIKDEQADISDKPLETNDALTKDAVDVADRSVETNILVSEEATKSEGEADVQSELRVDHAEQSESVDPSSEVVPLKKTESIQDESTNFVDPELNEAHHAPNLQKDEDELKTQSEETSHEVSTVEVLEPSYDSQAGNVTERDDVQSVTAITAEEDQPHLLQGSGDVSVMVSEVVSKEESATAKAYIPGQLASDNQIDVKEHRLSSESNPFENADSKLELEKVTREMKMMETALLGAARQAQAKADEIAKLMNENEQLKSIIEDQRRKPNEADIESLREEYHQRVSTLERKVYALTKERDTLRREQNKKSDAAALLKEKDEIITQIMAEGEGLSKKQATQESLIRKLRAQIREFEEEKKGMMAKLQVEESKVESIRRDKAATEKLLQLTIEKNQAELATQKEYYTNALTSAKEAEALAEARANTEAKTEVENRLKEAEEREVMLVQTLEELRQTLSRTEQQAVFREEMLRRDIEDLQKRYQESERRCEELVMQVPDSTRPLLRQIEAMQETTARRAEAWTAVERSLTSRLQEAEAKSAAAEERERSVNERLSQTLSRINVLEAQLRLELLQLHSTTMIRRDGREECVNNSYQTPVLLSCVCSASETNTTISEFLLVRHNQPPSQSPFQVQTNQPPSQNPFQVQTNQPPSQNPFQASLCLELHTGGSFSLCSGGDTHKDHVNQREEEIRELKRKHKQELQEALTHQELLRQDIERERATRLELETTARQQSSIASEPSPLARTKSLYDNGLTHRLSNASSIGSMEESFFLQASLGSSDTLSERRNHGEPTVSSYYLKSMTPNAFEAALRQKEGELASYMSRLASMESIRDSLAEELVKMTEECEKLRSEVSLMPGLKADIEALRSRHSAALELMGERDEELEELRADIVDLKEMYREQVNMLVNKIQAGQANGVAQADVVNPHGSGVGGEVGGSEPDADYWIPDLIVVPFLDPTSVAGQASEASAVGRQTDMVVPLLEPMVCVTNRNPMDFTVEEAKKYMRTE